jgi:rhodanese-related sulfurtransferase/polyisoprenoid-binding protein YceI
LSRVANAQANTRKSISRFKADGRVESGFFLAPAISAHHKEKRTISLKFGKLWNRRATKFCSCYGQRMNEIIQTTQLRTQLASTNPPLLIDVRLEEDFEAAHIPEAINNCVYEVAFTERLREIAPRQKSPVVVYGANSESYEARIAAEKLSRAGYALVYEYRDGFAGWEVAGGPINRGAMQPAEPQISDGAHPIDLTESWVEWTGRNLLSKHRGRVGLKSGQLEFVQGQLIRGDVIIDLKNIVCFDLQGTPAHDILLHHLQSDDFFDVERFPEALLVINSARKIDGASPGQLNYEIIADLTLKSVVASLAFHAAAGVTPDGRAAAQAMLSFDRTRWNVLYGSARFFRRVGMHLVNDLVDLEVKVVTH